MLKLRESFERERERKRANRSIRVIEITLGCYLNKKGLIANMNIFV